MRDLLVTGAMIGAVAGVLMSMYLLIKKQPLPDRRISVRRFTVLVIVYINVMTGFGVVYLCLELLGKPVLAEGDAVHYETFFHLVEDVLYFSAVTLLTVGYGDIVPSGIGRWIAMIQALIGYLLPAAFVVTTFIYHEPQGKSRSDEGG